MKAEEAYYATFQTYITFNASGPMTVTTPSTSISGTVTVNMVAAGPSFSGTAVSSRGTGKIYRLRQHHRHVPGELTVSARYLARERY